MGFAVMLPVLYAKIAGTLAQERPDVIHCTHLSLLPLCLVLARAKKAKVVYDAYEMHAVDWAEYVPIGRSAVRRLIEGIEDWLVRRVDLVLTIDSVGGFLEGRYRRANSNVTVLYNVPKKDVVLSGERIRFLQERYQDTDLVVYVGGAYEAKGLLVALEALRLVREKMARVKLIIIGKIDDSKGKAEKLLQTTDLRAHVEVIPWLPYDEMMHYLHVARVGLALHQPTGRFLLVSRGNGRKFFAYMQAGLPIVGPAFGEIGRVVREEGCGVLVDTTDPYQVAEAVLDLLRHPEKAREMGERGRRAIQEKYNWEKEQEKLLRAYRALFEDGRWRSGCS